MAESVRDTQGMLAGMAPVLAQGRYVFCTTQDDVLAARVAAAAIATVREGEGLSLILPLAVAVDHGLATDLPMRRITLQVHSSLEGVGLTAAMATALAEIGIPCNMVAGYHHDHVFVPEGDADRAMTCLQTLSGTAKKHGK